MYWYKKAEKNNLEDSGEMAERLTKIVRNDFEHRDFCDGPKGEIQEVFRNASSDRGAPVTSTTGKVVNI